VFRLSPFLPCQPPPKCRCLSSPPLPARSALRSGCCPQISRRSLDPSLSPDLGAPFQSRYLLNPPELADSILLFSLDTRGDAMLFFTALPKELSERIPLPTLVHRRFPPPVKKIETPICSTIPLAKSPSYWTILLRSSRRRDPVPIKALPSRRSSMRSHCTKHFFCGSAFPPTNEMVFLGSVHSPRR